MNTNKSTVEPPSPGTIAAEKARARCNGYSDEKRANLFKVGMAIINGGKSKVNAESRR
jgi:hypothetical protein